MIHVRHARHVLSLCMPLDRDPLNIRRYEHTNIRIYDTNIRYEYTTIRIYVRQPSNKTTHHHHIHRHQSPSTTRLHSEAKPCRLSPQPHTHVLRPTDIRTLMSQVSSSASLPSKQSNHSSLHFSTSHTLLRFYYHCHCHCHCHCQCHCPYQQ